MSWDDVGFRFLSLRCGDRGVEFSFRVWGLGFGVTVRGLGFRLSGSEFRA